MEFIKLTATSRTTTGKGAARRLRKKGLVPAVLYGGGQQARSLTVAPDALKKALSGPLRINTPLDLEIDDNGATTNVLAIVKDHQYDPVSRELLHVDFMTVTPGHPLKVHVPLVKKGRSIGEQMGAVLRMVHRTVPVVCLPKDIPESIVIDVTELKAGTTLHAADVPVPEGIRIDLPASEAIITISSIDVEEETAEDAESTTA